MRAVAPLCVRARVALAGRFGGRREQRQVQSLAVHIGDHRAALAEFARASDAEFTSLARELSEINRRLVTVRSESAALNAVLQGSDEDQALASAYSVYKTSVDLVHSSIGFAVSEQQQMLDVQSALERICAGREEFKRNSLMFRMLAMGVRMEASRLDAEQQGTFFNVASAIGAIEQDMTSTTEAAFERIQTVVAETAAERAQLGQLQTTLLNRAQDSIRTIHGELERLKGALRPCADHGREIEGLLEVASGRMAQLITALQMQDIVRQKLEHVSAGFEDLEAHVGLSGQIQARNIDLRYVHDAAQLQRTQLASARVEISRAGDSLVNGTRELLGATNGLAREFDQMEAAASAAFRDCRVTEMFQAEIRKLSEIARQSEETNQKVAEVADRIEQIVTVFAREICQHQFDVKLVSLNAQIAAARLSSADALNKLAEEAIRVSETNSNATRQFSSDLDSALAQLSRIKRDAAEFLTTITKEKNTLEVGAEAVTAKLGRLTARIEGASTSVTREFAQVDTDVSRMLAAFRFPHQIEECWSGAEGVCADLAASAGACASSPAQAETQERIDAHQRRYTMRAEFETHAAALNDTSPRSQLDQPKAATAPAKPASSEDLGDGIELF